MMTPERFFLINGLILLLVVIYIIRKRPKSQIRFNFKRGKSYAGMANAMAQKDFAAAATMEPSPKPEKTLNTLFNYNGHTWDAYEVLGLPAGANLERVERAYQNNIASMNPESRAFVEAAYKAICTQKSKT